MLPLERLQGDDRDRRVVHPGAHPHAARRLHGHDQRDDAPDQKDPGGAVEPRQALGAAQRCQRVLSGSDRDSLVVNSQTFFLWFIFGYF